MDTLIERTSAKAQHATSPGDTHCAAVSASTWVESDGKFTIVFFVSWSSLKFKFCKGKSYHRRYTKYYGTSEMAAKDLVPDSLTNYMLWEEEIEKWQNPILKDEQLHECRDDFADERLGALLEDGARMYHCRTIKNCTTTCPKSLNPAISINKMKLRQKLSFPAKELEA